MGALVFFLISDGIVVIVFLLGFLDEQVGRDSILLLHVIVCSAHTHQMIIKSAYRGKEKGGRERE